MILDGTYWNSGFQHSILWCVLSICRKKLSFYDVFWRHRSPSTVIYTTFFLKVQTVCRKTIVFEASKKSTRKFWILSKIHEKMLDFQKNPWDFFGFFCALAGRAHGDGRGGLRGGGKHMISVGTFCYLPIWPMISDGRCWNSLSQPVILWCVLSIGRKK